MFHHTSLPEVYHGTEETAKEPGPTYHTSKPSLKRLVVIIAIVIATAVAIGAGVGTWRRHQHSPHNSSSILNDTHPNLNHTSSVALGPILNDTSLAALVLANDYRYLFFQDNTGLVRAAIRTPPNGPWSTSADFNVTSNAKKHTPLAATNISDGFSQVLGKNSHSIYGPYNVDLFVGQAVLRLRKPCPQFK